MIAALLQLIREVPGWFRPTPERLRRRARRISNRGLRRVLAAVRMPGARSERVAARGFADLTRATALRRDAARMETE